MVTRDTRVVSESETAASFFARLKQRCALNSEVMKHMTCGIVFLLVAFATPVIYGGQPEPGPGHGVAGVDVLVKRRPDTRALTDARGNFALDALPAGSYTLTFRARRAGDLVSKGSTSDRFVVATSYSIKVEGAKRAVNKSGLTSDDLLAGYVVEVDLGAGGRVRGQVAAAATKTMVWISREPGSNLPGRWVDAASPEAKAAAHHNSHEMGLEELFHIGR